MKKITFLVLLICVMSIGCLFLVNNNLSKTNASLNNQLQQQEQMYSGKIDELTVYQEKLVERISLLEENYQKLQTAYDELKAAYDQYIQDSTIERETIQNTVVDLRETIAVLENNADVDAETITALRAEVTTLETSLENQTITANQLQATVTQQEATIAELNTTIEILTEELNSDLSGVYKKILDGTITQILPEHLNGVTAIRPYAFGHCYTLTSVELPTSVISIGEFAFSNCTSLRTVVFPDSVTTLANSVFYQCEKLSTFTGLGVESLPNSCFYYCTSLRTLNVSNKLTSVGLQCFYNCIALSSIKNFDNVVNYGASCFYSCTALTSFAFGNGEIKLDTAVFNRCSALKKVYFPLLENVDFSSATSYLKSPFSYAFYVTIYTGSTQLPEGISSYWNLNSSTSPCPVEFGYSYSQYSSISA